MILSNKVEFIQVTTFHHFYAIFSIMELHNTPVTVPHGLVVMHL